MDASLNIPVPTFVLHAICVIEQDLNQDCLVTWAYPSTDKFIPSEVLLQRTPFKNPVLAQSLEQHEEKYFLFSRFDNNWHYTLQTNLLNHATLKAFAIVIIAKDYNPEKYQAMTSLFAQCYSQEMSCVKLVQMFLSVFGTGKYGSEFASQVYDENKAKIGGIGLQGVVKIFGAEQSTLIWAAMLMKKRIIVVSEHVEDLQQITRALPCFTWHRQQWEIVKPLVNFSHEVETNDVKSSAIYVAGTLDTNVKSDTKLYDLLLDISSQRVHIAEQARGIC